MADKHTHTLTFTGLVPDSEMDRAPILGHPKVHEARDALLAALKEAGAEHKAVSVVTKPRQTRKPKAPAVRAAAE